ncbi:beta strand repeat-containing protein [Chryseobacterium herbae]|uniref:C1q domain-containing protein n=1 Tax=Chryseobacterium herbae TaxID=2976476 RepID=A0ABT2IPX2_9FLAO|nr:hypothetical protein [Chryseobacterium sp. pc1-10]MCT2560410.1 hypothetical protein [Chryseobacterium sp. pc1-10]
MKKIILPIVLVALGCVQQVNAQVGINTPTPTSTFDITAKEATGTAKTAEGLLIPRVDRQRAQSMTDVPTSTLVYVNSIATGTATGTAANIDAIGYYYYNGTAWTKLTTGGSTNIYTADGTLAGNRIVTQGANTLAFTGTATNAFSVDGTTLSVDAENNRVGIGTAAPGQALSIVDGSSNNNFGIATFTHSNLTQGVGIGWEGIQSVGTKADASLSLNAKGAGHIVMQNSGTTGNVGINTTAPSSTLDISAKNATGTTTKAEGLLIPRVDRQRAQSMTGVPTSTLVYVNSIATGTATGTAANIDAIGYYYYNGTAWTKLGSDTNTNIYTNDGTLAGNRIVTQGANTLAFTGTATNAFSVDGTTLSVDATNNRIGIGTAAPGEALSIVDGSSNNNYSIATFTHSNLTKGVGIGWEGVQSRGSSTNVDLNLNAKGTGNIIMQTNGTTGNVGIGTTTPHAPLQFANTEGNRKMVLYETANNDHQYYGLGINSSVLRYQLDGTSASHAFYAGTSTTTSNELMRITGTGRVGIGTTAPGEALSVVDGSSSNDYSIATFTHSNLTQGVGIGWTGIQSRGTDANINLNLNAKGAGNILMQTTGNIGAGTTTPQRKLHVAGGLQVTNELNVGGSATAAGSAGTTGQVLTSNGAGAAPSWGSAATSTNIYSNDGTLAGNRIVTQGANTLAFTGTATNAFSVDGTTFSVDATNNRIGIGTTAPGNALTVVDGSSSNDYSIATFTHSNLTQGVGIGWTGIQSRGTDANINLNLNAKGSGNILMQTSGNIGAGTTSPQRKLHVAGGLQVTNELNVGGSATTAGSAGTTGQVLTSRGANTAPQWESPDAGGFISRVVASGRTSGVQTNSGNGFKSLGFGSIRNPGGGWDTGNNSYTVPTSGYYQVSMFAAIKASNAAYRIVWLFKVGGERFPFYEQADTSGGNYIRRGGTMTTYIDAGSVITIGYEQNANSHDVGAGATFAIVYLGN